MIYTLQETAKKVVEWWEVVNPVTQYQQTNSPDWSSYTSLKNKWREFNKRSKQFPFGDNLINTHNFSLDYILKLSGEHWCWSFLGLQGFCERKQKKNVPQPLASTPTLPLFHSPLEVYLKTVCYIDFYPYISRPVYGEIIFHSIFKICGRIPMVWSLKWNLFSTSTWYYLFSTLF